LGDRYPSREVITNSTLEPDANYPHPWSVFFTVLGTVLLDFDADACQSPSRAYLLDITVPGENKPTSSIAKRLLCSHNAIVSCYSIFAYPMISHSAYQRLTVLTKIRFTGVD
jgi:hypothetical protein